VDLNLASALSNVKVAIKETADKSSIRRLNLYADEIRCKPACTSCCNRQIYVTVAEALVIQEYLEKTGQWPQVEQRAKLLLSIARDTPPISWFKMGIMCPVLNPENKLCTAYETRPSPCSTHFVKSDPSLCDPLTLKSGTYKPIDFIDLHDEFRKFLEKNVDGYGILALKLPISVALVFAARIKIQSKKSAGEIMELIYSELSK